MSRIELTVRLVQSRFLEKPFARILTAERHHPRHRSRSPRPSTAGSSSEGQLEIWRLVRLCTGGNPYPKSGIGVLYGRQIVGNGFARLARGRDTDGLRRGEENRITEGTTYRIPKGLGVALVNGA